MKTTLYICLSFFCLLYSATGQTFSWQESNVGLVGAEIRSLHTNGQGTMFAGTLSGVFRSIDNGQTWAEANSGLPTSTWVLAITSDAAGILCIGTSLGLFRSTDNGDTWVKANLPRLQSIYCFAVKGGTDLFAGGYGVSRSTDHGATWIDAGLSGIFIQALKVNSAGDIFAASAQNALTPSTPGGLYRSTDNGQNWIKIIDGISNVDLRSIGIGAQNHLFVASGFGQIYHSTDNGDHWAMTFQGPGTITAIETDSSGNLYCASYGICRSTDNGTTWQYFGYEQLNIGTSSLTINRTGEIFVGTFGKGIFYSTDRGVSWKQTNTGIAKMYIGAVSSNSQGDIFAGTSNNGVFRSTNHGMTWSKTGDIGNKWVNCVTIGSDDYIFAGTSLGGVFRSGNNGQNWEHNHNGMPDDERVRVIAINSIGHVYAGSDGHGLFRSKTYGQNWERVPLLDSTATGIFALAINSLGHIFAATFQAGLTRLFLSSDDGNSWTQLPNPSSNTRIHSIIIDNKNTLFLCGEGIYRSIDNGAHWTPIGLANKVISSIAFGPNGKFFAGSFNFGAYSSNDSGVTWIEINSGLKSLEVLSLCFDKAGYLYAGTTAGLYRSFNPITEVKNETEPPKFFSLKQNYPNPFNPSTNIEFSLPTSTYMTLKVFNLLGEEVKTLLKGYFVAGDHEINQDFSNLPSGVYLYRLEAGSIVETKKLILLK
ncbi:MAG: T9SS type A sorting domain-containing protein [Ignavibacteriales bacterium]|nr:T9SS type A sorting domain-containing protein [Ignavibacteriales bacterium]